MPRPLDETPRWCPSTTLASCAAARGTTSNPRLVARVFGAANPPLRVRLLSCLIQPLGTLGIAGVAAGAFAVFVGRDGPSATRIDFEAVAQVAQVAQVTSRQVHELARFVEQVDPQALLQFASLASGSSLALASGFSAAALALLYRRLQPTMTARAASAASLAPRVRRAA